MLALGQALTRERFPSRANPASPGDEPLKLPIRAITTHLLTVRVTMTRPVSN
jgi:hypothetical protein